MTIVANTFTTFDQKGIREDLSNTIYNISPENTPLVSLAAKERGKQTNIEWQTDELAAVDTANKHLEGDDIATFPAVAPTVRVGNFMQISRKLLILSGTAEVVDKAGRKSELAYQTAKRGSELKRDMEAIAFENQAGDAGGTATARATATLGAWLKTNTSLGAGGGDPTYTSGVPLAVRTDGTLRAFTETLLKAVIQSMYTEGAELHFMFVGAVNKQRASTFTGVATRNYDLSGKPRPTAIIAAADVYVSDFGFLQIMPTRFQRERDAYLIDPQFVAISHLRPMHRQKLAKTGDAEKRMLLVEWALKIRQEAGLGLVADLTTT